MCTRCKWVNPNSNIKFIPTPVCDPENEGHYMPLGQVLQIAPPPLPTDDYIPSIKGNVRIITQEVQGCPSSALNAQTA